MQSKDLDYLIIVGLLLSGLYVAITGLVMDLFGLHRFFLHRYAGYVAAALGGLHLILNWGRVTAYLGRRLGRPSDRRSPRRRERAPGSGSRMGRRGFVVAGLGAVGGLLLGRLIPVGPRLTFPGQAADLGLLYHRWSKPGYSLALGPLLDWGAQPTGRKTYPKAERIPLPNPHDGWGRSLEEVLEAHRSIRDYRPEPLSLAELSRLLHAAQGITDHRRGFRAAPSAGALYPIETYAVVHNVEGLARGVYHYAVAEHTLERLRTDDLRAAMVVVGVGQEMLGQAGVCFVLSAIFQRTRWKYRERTYRYVLLEAGHIGQNLYLAATAMGLGACAVGAFLDDELNHLLGLDGEEEAALYLIAVGRR